MATRERLPIGAELVETGSWIEVRTARGHAHMRKQDVITAKDLGGKQVRVLSDLTSLRSAPLPYADLIRTLTPSAQLGVIGAQTLRWGQAKVTDIGEVWWPISDEAAPEDITNKDSEVGERVSTNDLFRRQIFDIVERLILPGAGS